jgi:hypothetical protein
MLDFFAFRDKARETFPSLIVSVTMEMKGSGAGGEITMYKAKVSGQGIGAELSCEGDNGEQVLTDLIAKVGAARREVNTGKKAWQMAGRTIAPRPAYRAAA